MILKNKFYDEYRTRYRLVKSCAGEKVYNWLFIPGGPGIDSIYLIDLINQLEAPGNYWLIDFPNNGDNLQGSNQATYDFRKWEDCLFAMISNFDYPVLVGHSFGGMFPLLFPELENQLQGLVILNSAPSLWYQEAEKCAKAHNLPSLEGPIGAFLADPCERTFAQATDVLLPYYFTEKNLELGKKLMQNTPTNFKATAWWIKESSEMPFNAKWIPKQVQTLILGGEYDFITPFSLFQGDHRFQRSNVILKQINGASHFSWLDKMEPVVQALEEFSRALT